MNDDFLGRVRLVVRELRAYADRELSRHGVRFGQYQLLRVLFDRDGQTPRELADAVVVEMPTVTRTVQRMVRDGLVRREANPDDARSIRIFLTAKGRGVRALADAVRAAATERALRDFSATERAKMLSNLDRILKNLTLN